MIAKKVFLSEDEFSQLESIAKINGCTNILMLLSKIASGEIPVGHLDATKTFYGKGGGGSSVGKPIYGSGGGSASGSAIARSNNG